MPTQRFGGGKEMISSHNSQPSARITVREICARLNLGERAVYALLEAQVIPSIRIRSRYLIGRCAYMEWEKHFGERSACALQ
jgi:excisionase family DNA binding protein